MGIVYSVYSALLSGRTVTVDPRPLSAPYLDYSHPSEFAVA